MRRSLVSLAVVTAMWEQRGHDYLDNFVPFVATLANARSITCIQRDHIPDLCDQFHDEFGLKLPFHPMVSLLNRCARRHLLHRSHGAYTIDQRVCSELCFANKRDLYTQKEGDLLKAFASYAHDTFGESVDISDAEDALLQFLRRFDMEVVLSRSRSQSALPERPKGKKHRRLLYMLSRFAIDAQDSTEAVFATLCDMAIGHMLTAAVMLDDYDWPSETVRGTSIYIDAPIILRLIGTRGESQAAVFDELLSDLREKGAKLWVFEHSRQEALNIVEGARFWAGRSDFDPELASITALYFRQQGYSDSEMERFILRFDDTLKRHGIDVFSDHKYVEKRLYQLDEGRLRSVIKESYGQSDGRSDPERREDGILTDVASLAAVYRLREGKTATLLKDVKHVFLSMNAALARASQVAVNAERSVRAIPVCVTDVFLGTVIWVNSPRQAKETQRKRLIGECYAAIAPDSGLEARIVREAQRLLERRKIDEDECLLLTTSFITRDLLAAKTLGDPDALDSRISFEILEDVKARMGTKEREKAAKAEVDRRKEELARERAETERDAIVAAIRRAGEDDAERKVRVVRVLLWIAIGAAVLLPVLPGTLLHIGWLGASGAAALVTAYLGFGKGFRVETHLARLRTKYSREYESRYLRN